MAVAPGQAADRGAWWQAADPRRLPAVLAALDRATLAGPADQPRAQARIWTTLVVAALCLFLTHYLRLDRAWLGCLRLLAEVAGEQPGFYIAHLRHSGWLALGGYVWWGGWLAVGYVLIPMLVITLLWRANPLDFGLRPRGLRAHWPGYVLLLAPILVFAIAASFREDFQHHYPFYRDADRSWFDLLAWEAIYCTQFLCLEFFFRGFLLRALAPAVGSRAIVIMAVPYLMIHFPKPWLEALGALPFGLLLGILAMRSGSIWGGFLVHCGLAVTMDLLAMVQTDTWPSTWWP